MGDFIYFSLKNDFVNFANKHNKRVNEEES